MSHDIKIRYPGGEFMATAKQIAFRLKLAKTRVGRLQKELAKNQANVKKLTGDLSKANKAKKGKK